MSDAPTWSPPSEWLNVYEVRDSLCRIAVHEESKIDAAVNRFRECGVDSLLHLEFAEGAEEYCVLASRIVSWYRNTSEFRARTRLLERMIESEKKAEGWSE